MLRERNIVLNLVLTVITCGLYGLYWQASITNELQEKTGRRVTASGGLAALYTFVTCSIYFYYWLFKTGALVSELREARHLPPDGASHENYIISALAALVVSLLLAGAVAILMLGAAGAVGSGMVETMPAGADDESAAELVGELIGNVISMGFGLVVNIVLTLAFILLVVKRGLDKSSSLLLMLSGLLMAKLLFEPLLALGFLQKSLNGLSVDKEREAIQ